MVLIKNLTQTQVNGIADNYKGEVITNADSNKLMFNNGTGFTYLVYSDLNNVITGLSGVSATNLTGTLQTAAQPNVTSLGTLTGLTVNNNLVVAQHNGVDKGLTLGGTLVTSSADQLNYVNTTPGTAEAGKALITDSNNSIVGLTNLETDNLTVNGTLVTSSAIELNYVDVNTLGVAQASKALVVDADRNITNINTLEADFIQVNGTLVTSSAIELNYVDVDTLGIAQASKALVVDASRNISNLNNVSAVNLTGTLQTAAQPNITSVGTLQGLTVTGTTNLESLSVNGVPLDAFKLGGLKLRVYSTPDFTGRVIKADIINTVNFVNYEPVTGTTTNYSLEAWGYIKPLYTESYTFTVSSNDRFRLWINNQLVRTEWTDGDDNNLQTSPIALTAGQWYPVYIQHAQYTGTEKLSLTWSSPTQTSELVPAAAMAYDDKMLTVNSHESFVQDKITLYDSVNTTQTSLAVNSNGDLAITAASNNVNIVGHNGSTTGLKLAGTLVTATATELNYNDTTVGTGASAKAVILDSNRDFTGIRNLTTDGLLGINTTTPDKQVEINSATGEALRLTYNDTANYADFDVSSVGILTVNASGDKINLKDNVNMADHDGSTIGLQLAGILVTATAAELNYVDTTQGAAEASKALVLDSSRNLTNVNNLSLTGSLATSLVTDSTSSTTGSIVTAGGVGIAKNLNVGAAAAVATTLSVGTDLTVGGTLGVTGAAALSDALSVSGAITNSNTTQSTSTSSGAITTAGGVGIAKNLNVGGTVTVTGNATLSANLSVNGPALVIPVGNTAARPTGAAGQIRYNSETSQFEGFGAGNTWGSLGGVTDVNQDTYISAEDTAGANNDELKFFNNGSESMRLTALGLMGLGTSAPAKKLEINSATGDALRLTYNDNNGSAVNYADFDISSTGILTVNASGAKINLNDNVNVADHDGAEVGLQLAGVLVTATATELNYVDTTPGTAEASKALVLNSARNLSNVNNLSLTGNLVATGSATVSSVYLANSEVDSSVFKINYLSGYTANQTKTGYQWHTASTDVSVGSKIMELDSELSLTVPFLSSNSTQSTSTTTGAITTAGGVGIAKNLNVGGSLTLTGDAALDANVTITGPSFVIPVGDIASRPTGVTGQIRYNSETSLFEGYGAGNVWSPLGGAEIADVDKNTKITVEDSPGSNNNEIKFFNDGSESMRITSTGSLGLGTSAPSKKLEINSATGDVLRLTYNDTDGSAVDYVDLNVSASGNLVINSSGNETQIASSDSFNVVGHNGSTLGLKLAGVLVTATANELNYVDTTAGTAEASKALVLDSSRNLTNVNQLTLSTLISDATTDSTSVSTGAITTAGGVGIAKNLTMGGIFSNTNVTQSTSVSTGSFVTAGGAGIAKNLFIGGTLNATGAATLSDTLSVSGAITNSNTTQSTSTSSGAITTAGGVGIAKNLNVGGTMTVTGDTTLSANLSVAGPALVIPVGNTAARPVGAAGQIRYNSETSQFEGFGAGNTWGSLGGVTDVNQDTYISAEDTAGANNDELKFFNNGSESMRLTALGLMGLGTSTPAKKLEINSATGDALRLTYNDNNGSAANYVDFDISSAGILTVNASGNQINLNDNVNVADHNGSTIGLRLAGVLVTATAAELNYVDTTPGTAEASKALVLDSSRNLTNVNALTATTLNATTVNATNVKTTGNVGINTSDLTFGLQINEATGNVLRLVYNDSDGAAASSADFTIDNASNLSINAAGSVNIATHNGSSTGLKLAGVLVTATASELNYVDTTPGAAQASKALVVDANRDITNINSISMNSLNLTFDNATGNSVGAPLVITRTTSATPANGLGVGMTYKLENSANANIEFGNTQVVSTDITAASEDGNFVVNLMTNGALVESMRLSSTTMYVNELYETSDRRVKENFVSADLSETHARVLKLKLTDYNYIGNTKTHRGLIAQEVEEIIPVAIETADRNGISDFKSVSNREITNHLVGSVQYLSQKLEEALAKIAELESRL
jgi:hypothetical protein